MSWQPYTHNGLVFDLSHLDDFEHTYIQAATTKNAEKRYKVFVTFTDHPFTDSSNEDGVSIYSRTHSREGIKNRYFNFKRWMYSRQLPALIREFATGNKHFYVLQDGAYFRLELLNDQNHMIEYDIFFDLYKEKKRLVLIIKSAYERAPNSNERPKLDRTNNFSFFTLLNATSQGKRIHRKY
jgi:hypothetical protein